MLCYAIIITKTCLNKTENFSTAMQMEQEDQSILFRGAHLMGTWCCPAALSVKTIKAHPFSTASEALNEIKEN